MYNLFYYKALEIGINESWVDWAIEMVEAGYESINLYQLAGEIKPYNQFELHHLFENVLKDLELDYEDLETTIRNYVHFIISENIESPLNYLKTLEEIVNIYYDLDMDSDYYDFYNLYFAKLDLLDSEDQYYWLEANRNNIDQSIKDKFQEFINKYEKTK